MAGVRGVVIITAKSAHVPTDIGLCGWAGMTQRGRSGSMSCTARVKAWVESLTRNEGRRHMAVVTSSKGKRRRLKAGV